MERDLDSFSEKVLALTSKIPHGKITTYQKIAKKLGNPRASRAVGNALNKNTQLVIVPCHRVVRSDGSIGGYASGLKKKKELLSEEGVKIKNNKVVNLDEVIW